MIAVDGLFTSSYGGPGTFSSVRFIWGNNGWFGNVSGNINTDFIGQENISPYGTPLFSGSVTHPVFAEGSWTNRYSVISASFVPEPASWAMLIGGLGIVGAAARRRRLVAVAA